MTLDQLGHPTTLCLACSPRGFLCGLTEDHGGDTHIAYAEAAPIESWPVNGSILPAVNIANQRD